MADCLKKHIWKHIKQNKLTVKLFDEKPSEKIIHGLERLNYRLKKRCHDFSNKLVRI